MTIRSAANNASHDKDAFGEKRARKSESVYQDLMGRILTGELKSDSAMTEQSLAQEYACSQSTIREALMLLQECGLVIRKGYQGTFVTDPSLAEATLLLRLRINTEVAGLTEAAKTITPAQIAELRDLDRQFLEARRQRDVYACAEIDREFHLQIFRCAGMSALEPLLVRTLVMLQRITLATPRPDYSWTHPKIVQHESILDALEAGDSDAAVSALKSHVFSSVTLLAPQFYGQDTARLRAQHEPDLSPISL
ncbi:GntR family transcriptional regulator [Roseibium sp. MMSF_3412]|uniref:GntR family transcriptional regulator n=1 Tax=Roseibium sp. MMSF_3412 TaxID=3046712 RepID=UPI00273D9E2A|nr:GntR family transcriptional regulator [Roseibium sp. MMSF_3412]